MRTTTRLRQMMKEPGIIVAPGAYDGFSARLIEAAGFRCVYMTGAGTAASHLGQPDLGLATLTEMANHASHLASCVSLPVIADADTGYGNVLNVVRTVREYERAGVAGLHMEDQVAPKKCGHIAGKQVIPTQEFCDKIRAASEHRTDPDFVIIARTDARAVTSLDDAIDRGNRAAEAGADVVFVEAPQTEDEIHRVAREVKAPLLANMVQGGKTPAVKVAELERIGFKIVIFPAVCMAAAVPAIERALASLKETGTDWHDGPVLSPMDIFRKVGFDWWHAIEEKFPPPSCPPARMRGSRETPPCPPCSRRSGAATSWPKVLAGSRSCTWTGTCSTRARPTPSRASRRRGGQCASPAVSSPRRTTMSRRDRGRRLRPTWRSAAWSRGWSAPHGSRASRFSDRAMRGRASCT